MSSEFQIKAVPDLPKHPEHAADFFTDDIGMNQDCACLHGKWDGSVELHWFTDEKGGTDGNSSIDIGDLDFFIEFLIATRAKAREYFRNEKWPNS